MVVFIMDNSSGQKMFALNVGLGDFAGLVAGAALIAFAAVMREAARLAAENREFV